MHEKWPKLAYNWTSITGSVIAIAAVFAIAFLFLINFISPPASAYIGILLYLALPAVLFVGLLLIPVGMYRKWRRLKRGGFLPPHAWPVADFNNPQYRNAALLFMLGTFFFLLISAVGIYGAYQYAGSVAFCAQLCHGVMKPEAVTYPNSPHARIGCVRCHIGPGAGWYAKSKLSGLYQVYATLANKYPRPLPASREELRPVRVQCYRCHWPNQLYGDERRVFNHFRYDSRNSPWPIVMLVKVGGPTGNPATGGIHWHMDIAVRVEFISRDGREQDVPWVKITYLDTGKTDVYQDVNRPLTEKELKSARPKLMECIDCHNRPSHRFNSPDYLVDSGMADGSIDRGIPDIKKIAVQALANNYRSTPDAMKEINSFIRAYYLKNYPEFCSRCQGPLDRASTAIRKSYSENFFPEMKSKWSEYPDNIGHFIFRGCMRCHDGEHKDASGRAITNDCRACHIIILQGPGTVCQTEDLKRGLDFIHPTDIGDAWKGGACAGCHTGTQPGA